MSQFTYDVKAFGPEKGDWMVVHNGDKTAVALSATEDGAREDAAARNGKAERFGLRVRYEVHHRSDGTAVRHEEKAGKKAAKVA